MANIQSVAIFIISLSSAIFFPVIDSQEFSKTLCIRAKELKTSPPPFLLARDNGQKNDTEYHITQEESPSFRSTTQMDDPLTEGPELGSKLVGRCQGMYASTLRSTTSYLIASTFVFDEGNFNGSTVSVLGWDSVLWPMREMSIVGGSRMFRFDPGYAESKTHFRNVTDGVVYAVVQYDIYVVHYY